jgi:pilus assembly protein Flp/PilA
MLAKTRTGKRVKTGNFRMEKLGKLLHHLHDDQSGAAFIEYTVLLGVILAVGVGIIVAIGTWANGRWDALNTAVNP